MLLVADLDRAVAYNRDRLGFRCDVFGDPLDFATVERDQATILLALCGEPERTPSGFREFGVQDPDGHDIAFGQPLNR